MVEFRSSSSPAIHVVSDHGDFASVCEGEGRLNERESSDHAFFLASVHSQVRVAHSVAELNFKAKNR